MSEKKINITGKCYCGAIRYRIDSDVLKSAVCHCNDCQSLTGGSSWPLIMVPSKSLFVEGEPKEFSRPGSSGYLVHVSFCGTCGSTVLGRLDAYPYIRTVSASSLDDKSIFSPNMHLWTEQAPKWQAFNDDVAKFARSSMADINAEDTWIISIKQGLEAGHKKGFD